MNFSGVFNETYSSKVKINLFPLKFVEKFSGWELIILGGVMSFGPPVGETMVAQATAKSVIAAGIRSVSSCREYLCRLDGICSMYLFCKDEKKSASKGELLYILILCI